MSKPIPIQSIDGSIHTMRGQRVMLDAELARFYGVSPKRLLEQLRRNAERFPGDFAFQLTRAEMAELRSLQPNEFEDVSNLKSQIATSSLQLSENELVTEDDLASISHGGRRSRPWAFTEHGVIMLASVLNSPIAIEASVRVVRAFVRLRELALNNRQLALRLDEIEKRVGDHDGHLASLFEAIRQLLLPPKPSEKREIGFHVREKPPAYRVRKQRPSK